MQPCCVVFADVLIVEHDESEATNSYMNIEESSIEFGALISKILEILMKNKDKSLILLKSICSNLTIKSNSKIRVFDDEQLSKIMGCSDVQLLFLTELRGYWRWDEFPLLKKIVSLLDSKKCTILLDQYEKKIDAKIKLSEIYEHHKKENCFPKGYYKMVAITNKSFSDITKKEYSALRNFISQHCGVEPHAMSPLNKASSSSLVLEWYIPGGAVAYMIETASDNKQVFINHGFVYLKIVTSVILEERDNVS